MTALSTPCKGILVFGFIASIASETPANQRRGRAVSGLDYERDNRDRQPEATGIFLAKATVDVSAALHEGP